MSAAGVVLVSFHIGQHSPANTAASSSHNNKLIFLTTLLSLSLSTALRRHLQATTNSENICSICQKMLKDLSHLRKYSQGETKQHRPNVQIEANVERRKLNFLNQP